MNILFLTHYFPPEVNAPASRTYEHCKRWVAWGHNVTVVTCVPNHPTGKIYPGFRNTLFQKEVVDEIKVVRVLTYLTPNKGVIKRSFNYLFFGIMSIMVSPLIHRTDVVISTSPQFFCGLAGYFVSKIKRVPWVLEVRDLWPDSILAVAAIKNRAVIKSLYALEMFAYRRAESIVSVTDSFKHYMIRKGIPTSKVEVVKNGADLSLFKPLPRHNPISHRLGLDDKFVVSYFGTHGMAHGLEVIFEAAKKLKHLKDVRFLMVGDGARREELVKIRDNESLDNVIMLPQVPKSEMPYFWATSDVCLVLLKNSNLFKTVIPSKLFEAMAMERPIVLGVSGESKEIVEMCGAGICIQPESARDLVSAISKLRENKELGAELGKNGRKCVEKSYNRDVSAGKFLQLLERVGAKNKKGDRV